ncbi:four helix bundle protein [Dyadobacter sp. 32]|uniref:four helix bundle protein n=1 Tax=Dyadobacter sp. 32 TaxID=538966 RepID=UPI0039C71907
MSFGSCQEIEYLMLLARDLDCRDGQSYQPLFVEIVSIKMQLYHLIKKLNAGS